jgi:hypothetical protein
MGSVARWLGVLLQFGSSMIGLFELFRTSSGDIEKTGAHC